MHLNHVNLPVTNVAAARSFFERFLGFETVRAGGDALAILDDGYGTTLVLMNVGRLDAARDGSEPPVYPAGFHVGFIVDSRTEVDGVYARLAAAGHPLDHEPRRQHGSYGFYVTALDGILFEVATTAP
jgi:catechol 2,3-dioxygenase-like lactoylglutathione lyase family enzyme